MYLGFRRPPGLQIEKAARCFRAQAGEGPPEHAAPRDRALPWHKDTRGTSPHKWETQSKRLPGRSTAPERLTRAEPPQGCRPSSQRLRCLGETWFLFCGC